MRWFEGGRTGTMLGLTIRKRCSTRGENLRARSMARRLPSVPSSVTFSPRSLARPTCRLNGLFRLPSIGLRRPHVGIGAGVALPHWKCRGSGIPAARTNINAPVVALIGIEFARRAVVYSSTSSPRELPDAADASGRNILFTDLWRQFKRWLSGEESPGGF
jgi:hypothetical protein